MTLAAARHGVDDGHAVFADEFQQRLVGIEAVEDAQIGLVRIAQFVLVLVGLRQIEDTGDADARFARRSGRA